MNRLSVSRDAPGEGDPVVLLAEGSTNFDEVGRFLALTHDSNPLHRDRGFAREKGFPGPVVPAGLSGAWLLRLLDGDWREGLELELVFVRPLAIGEPFRIWLSRDESGGEELKLEAESGEICVVLRPTPSGADDGLISADSIRGRRHGD